jgi:hypothetical protein
MAISTVLAFSPELMSTFLPYPDKHVPMKYYATGPYLVGGHQSGFRVVSSLARVTPGKGPDGGLGVDLLIVIATIDVLLIRAGKICA